MTIFHVLRYPIHERMTTEEMLIFAKQFPRDWWDKMIVELRKANSKDSPWYKDVEFIKRYLYEYDGDEI